MRTIPVVNVHDFTHGTPQERDRFVKAWGDGLLEYGFVTVDQHSVPLDLTKKVFNIAKDFFTQSPEVKRSYIVPNTGGARGYTAYGKEKAKDAKVHDLKEFWHVGQENLQGPLAHLYPKNVWPTESKTAEFKPLVLEIYQKMEVCADVLLTALALYLKLPPDHFAVMARGGNSVLRIIHYPSIPSDAQPEAVRAAAHEDINLITMLCEASTGGLELLTRQNEWLPIRSTNGQIIVDAGDMLQWATNGLIPSTTHRVVNPDLKDNSPRYSMPFFVHPRPDVILEPAITTVSAEKPAKYKPITAHDYLTQRLREIGLYDKDPMMSIS